MLSRRQILSIVPALPTALLLPTPAKASRRSMLTVVGTYTPGSSKDLAQEMGDLLVEGLRLNRCELITQGQIRCRFYQAGGSDWALPKGHDPTLSMNLAGLAPVREHNGAWVLPETISHKDLEDRAGSRLLPTLGLFANYRLTVYSLSRGRLGSFQEDLAFRDKMRTLILSFKLQADVVNL